jgi:hypothetical protein
MAYTPSGGLPLGPWSEGLAAWQTRPRPRDNSVHADPVKQPQVLGLPGQAASNCCLPLTDAMRASRLNGPRHHPQPASIFHPQHKPLPPAHWQLATPPRLPESTACTLSSPHAWASCSCRQPRQGLCGVQRETALAATRPTGPHLDTACSHATSPDNQLSALACLILFSGVWAEQAIDSA